MARVRFEGECCQDCLFFIANGDLPHGTTKEQDEKFIARIMERWPGDRYHLCVGKELDEFSNSKCGSCGTYVAGSRHEFIVLTK